MVVCVFAQAAEGEKNSKAARRIVKLLDRIDLDSLLDVDGDFGQVAQLYHDCARVCLEGAHGAAGGVFSYPQFASCPYSRCCCWPRPASTPYVCFCSSFHLSGPVSIRKCELWALKR